MKKIILLFAVLFAVTANAQHNAGNRPQLLLNKEIRITPLPSYKVQDGYLLFYADMKRTKYKEDKNYKYNTTPSALEGRIFKVTSIEQYVSFDKKIDMLVLKDANETVYYKYEIDKSSYPFEVIGGIDYPDDFYDSYINPYEDLYGKTGYETVDRNHGHIVFQKEKGKTVKYKLILKASSDNRVDGRKGVVLQLENGIQLDFPKADVFDWSPPKGYRATIDLTSADIEKLKAGKIVAFSVLDEMEKVDPEKGHYLKGVLNRLVTK